MKKIIFVLLLLITITGCTSNALTNNNTSHMETEKNNNPINTNQINEEKQMTNQQEEQNSPATLNNEEKKYALIKTSMGDIKIKLYAKESPITVENFKKYVEQKSFDGTIFHRVMDGFMIQGGGFDKNGNQKETLAPIKNEAKNGVKNNRGTLAMARTMVVDSATSQFFINLVDNDFLNYKDDANYGYAVFAEVVEGMDVVDKIAKVETGDNGMHQNWPLKDIEIISIEMVK